MAKKNYLQVSSFLKKILNTFSKIKGVLWTFNHLVLSSKHIERKINLFNYRMVNFKRITCIRKSNPWFTTAILFFKAGGWSSCFVKLLISWKEYWMLSDQNASQDVIIQSCMCIFYTLILHRTPLPFKMISIAFCSVDPKQYPEAQKWNMYLLQRGPKNLILRTGWFLVWSQVQGQPPHLRTQLFSHGKRCKFLIKGHLDVSGNKVFPTSVWMADSGLILPSEHGLATLAYLCRLLFSACTYQCWYIFVLEAHICAGFTLYLDFPGGIFFCSKILSERCFRLLSLAWILLLIKSPVLVEFCLRSHARHSNVCISWAECV